MPCVDKTWGQKHWQKSNGSEDICFETYIFKWYILLCFPQHILEKIEVEAHKFAMKLVKMEDHNVWGITENWSKETKLFFKQKKVDIAEVVLSKWHQRHQRHFHTSPTLWATVPPATLQRSNSTSNVLVVQVNSQGNRQRSSRTSIRQTKRLIGPKILFPKRESRPNGATKRSGSRAHITGHRHVIRTSWRTIGARKVHGSALLGQETGRGRTRSDQSHVAAARNNAPQTRPLSQL